ncbi:hypothetical protein VTJ49DRAFT_3198 [Mycothermus thermophilus]|uniref:PQ loop repeat protein n=1 Tax=Humicola insolens TaxID=85995 RepID=A0ABR3VPG4_HUMIN
MELFATNSKDRCEELRDLSVVNLIVSIFIVVGMLISYLPQHARIIKRGTSEGISPYFVLLGTTSATSAFANILLLPKSRQDVACCKELDSFHCIAGLLGIAQLGVQWICFSFIFVLFLVFFRYDTADVDLEDVPEEAAPRWQTALLVASLTLLHGLAVIVVTGILSTVAKEYLPTWANFLGVMAAFLAAVQYIPQIWTTYHLKHVGSLSIPMMCIQTPGGFVFAGSLFARLGWAGWSSWGIFVLTATMQGILLCLAVYYEVRAHKAREAPPKTPPPASYAEVYSESPADVRTDLQAALDRQDAESVSESSPLLRPTRTGESERNYQTNRD